MIRPRTTSPPCCPHCGQDLEIDAEPAPPGRYTESDGTEALGVVCFLSFLPFAILFGWNSTVIAIAMAVLTSVVACAALAFLVSRHRRTLRVRAILESAESVE